MLDNFVDKKTRENLKITAFLNLYALTKIPLLAFVSPRAVEFTKDKSVVTVPLGWRTKNHLGVMYFGALAVGAELSIAATAVMAIQESKKKIDFIFKDFKCNFVKRSDGDVHFVCDEAARVRELIDNSTKTSDRIEGTFKGYAIVPSKGMEPVMHFELTLSVRCRN